MSLDRAPATLKTPLRIATLSTRDHGGAGIGSLRRVEALRKAGVDAHLHVLMKRTTLPHVHQMPMRAGLVPGDAAEEAWQEECVVSKADAPDLSAQEMLSKPGCLVDYDALAPVLQQADVVHLHWVGGAIDYDKLARAAGDTPIVWTLADMNAFTGGCHYSEGCTNFLKNLHVVCPSKWLAEQARSSALLGDRPVHMIPNALPVDRFSPQNRLVARQKLGLPLDRKLILFGAEALDNERKGGALLRKGLDKLAKTIDMTGVEALVFGTAPIDLGLHVHAMGRVDDDDIMALVYAAADVMAFPSAADNAPLTVVESLLCATPVVGFDVGNVSELIEHGRSGYIARPADVDDFARGLSWALDRAGSQNALVGGLAGQVRARTHNDPAQAAARHIALYRQITGMHNDADQTQTQEAAAP